MESTAYRRGFPTHSLNTFPRPTKKNPITCLWHLHILTSVSEHIMSQCFLLTGCGERGGSSGWGRTGLPGEASLPAAGRRQWGTSPPTRPPGVTAKAVPSSAEDQWPAGVYRRACQPDRFTEEGKEKRAGVSSRVDCPREYHRAGFLKVQVEKG